MSTNIRGIECPTSEDIAKITQLFDEYTNELSDCYTQTIHAAEIPTLLFHANTILNYHHHLISLGLLRLSEEDQLLLERHASRGLCDLSEEGNVK